MKKNFCLIILSLLFAAASNSQSVLKGKIKDEKGVAIEAASVSIKGTSVFRVADAKGEFTLPAPKTFPFTIKRVPAG